MMPKLSRRKRLELWHAIEVLIARGDLELCSDEEFVWFRPPPEDAMTSLVPELVPFLAEWRAILVGQLRKDAAAKARAAKEE